MLQRWRKVLLMGKKVGLQKSSTSRVVFVQKNHATQATDIFFDVCYPSPFATLPGQKANEFFAGWHTFPGMAFVLSPIAGTVRGRTKHVCFRVPPKNLWESPKLSPKEESLEIQRDVYCALWSSLAEKNELQGFIKCQKWISMDLINRPQKHAANPRPDLSREKFRSIWFAVSELPKNVLK